MAVSIAAGRVRDHVGVPGAARRTASRSRSALVALITLLNLRGIRESGTIFAMPTYVFIVAFVVLLVGGFVRLSARSGPAGAPCRRRLHAAGTASLSAVPRAARVRLGLRRADGRRGDLERHPGVQEAGVEERLDDADVDGGHPGVFFIGITFLAHQLGVQHADKISAPAQIAKTVFGDAPDLLHRSRRRRR